MRIAYLILCHTDPGHIRRLVEKITKGTENEAFVHIDKKADTPAFRQALEELPQVHVLKNNRKVWWGGFSSVDATIRLLREALSYSERMCNGALDRFVILQGLDYPIRSNREIDRFFEENPKKEFILAQNISDSVDKKQVFKYRLYWFLDSRSFFANVLRGLTARLFLRTGWIPKLKKNYVPDNTGKPLKIHQGCAQFAITGALARYIVKFYDENPGVNSYFQTSYAPDESYFHTVVYNSPFVKNTPNGRAVTKPSLGDFENLTYFEYPVTVKLFKEKKDWPKLRDSGFLYFRKASSESKELLDYIDMVHDAQE